MDMTNKDFPNTINFENILKNQIKGTHYFNDFYNNTCNISLSLIKSI